MDEKSQTNDAEAPTFSSQAEANTDNQGSPAAHAHADAEGSASTTANSISNNEIIEVTEEDSFENDVAPPTLEDGDDDDDDSAVEIIDAASFREQQKATASTTANNNNNGGGGEGEDSDEELQCVGTANETKLPHNRQDCLEFRYNNSNHAINSSSSSCCADITLENAKFCQLCYCYVCDKPASECNNWYLGGKGVIYQDRNDDDQKKQSSSKPNKEEEGEKNSQLLQLYNNHCNATDKGGTKNLWKNMRTAMKNGHDPSAVTNAMASPNPDDSLAQYFARYTVPTAAATSASTNTTTAMLSDMAEQLRQRQRERHRYRAHATGRGGAHQRRSSHRDGGEGNYSSIYGSVSMDAANAMDFSSSTITTSSSSRRSIGSSRAPRQERRRRTRPTPAAAGSNNDEQRSRHSNHRDRMRTQAILEDLYS